MRSLDGSKSYSALAVNTLSREVDGMNRKQLEGVVGVGRSGNGDGASLESQSLRGSDTMGQW